MAYKFTTGSVFRGDIYYEDDTGKNTYIDWGEDNFDLYVGGMRFITAQEASTDLVVINKGGNDIDFQVKGDNQANLIRTVGSDDRVGIGTSSPASTFDVSGSQAGNLLSVGSADITLTEAHFMVLFEDSTGGQTGSLPEADTCGGRIYHIFNQTGGHSGGTIEISCSAHDSIDGQGTLTLDSTEEGGGNSSVSLVSNGDDGWLIFGQYSPSG